MKVAVQSIIEENNAFVELSKSCSLDRHEIVCVQSKTDMGVKQKIEFNKETIELKHKKSNLEK